MKKSTEISREEQLMRETDIDWLAWEHQNHTQHLKSHYKNYIQKINWDEHIEQHLLLRQLMKARKPRRKNGK